MNTLPSHKIISIEGNIGSGKSTLLKLINKKFENLETIKEPVCQWQQIGGNPNLNLLEYFYSDPKRWAYTFQSYAYYSRLKQWSELKINSDVAISERSVLSDRHIFAENGYRSQIIQEIEWELYKEYFNWLTEKFNANKISGVIYLCTDPEVCSQRINKRGRSEEKDTIQLDYLKQLHSRHEDWLRKSKENLSYPVLILDGNKDFDKEGDIQEDYINQIRDFINQK